VPAPQKWLGSSVAVGFDDDYVPHRTDAAEEEVRKKTMVSIFDWGRSELNTLESHVALSGDEQADREKFWKLYMGGVTRLAWEAARAYWHRFGNALGWTEVSLVVYKFDALLQDDYIGHYKIPITPTELTTVPLMDASGALVKSGKATATISYELTWQPLPADARLQGMWRLRVIEAENLPGSPDAWLSVTSFSEDGQFSFRQVTSVVAASACPRWDETLELPVSREDLRQSCTRRPSFLQELFEEHGVAKDAEAVAHLFPAATDVIVDAKESEPPPPHESLIQWTKLVNASSGFSSYSC